MPPKDCTNCQFWEPIAGEEDTGYCHAMPPIVVSVVTKINKHTDQVESRMEYRIPKSHPHPVACSLYKKS